MLNLTKTEIVLLWVAGLWAMLVFSDARIVDEIFSRGYRGLEIFRPVLALWIPLALVAFTIRAWPKR